MLKMKKRFPTGKVVGIGASALVIGTFVITGVMGTSYQHNIADGDVAISPEARQHSPNTQIRSSDQVDQKEDSYSHKNPSPKPSAHSLGNANTPGSGVYALPLSASSIGNPGLLTTTSAPHTPSVTLPAASPAPAPQTQVAQPPAPTPVSPSSRPSTPTPQDKNTDAPPAKSTQPAKRCSGLSLLGLVCIQ